MTPPDPLTELRAAVAAGGWRDALALLNARTGHRFTSLYRIDRDALRTLVFFDRADPAAGPPDDIPAEASDCVYVRDAGRPFRVEDALADPRVAGHPKQREVRAYYGAALTDAGGATVGTACHFDTRPAGVSEEAIARLDAFAGLVREHGLPRRGRA